MKTSLFTINITKDFLKVAATAVKDGNSLPPFPPPIFAHTAEVHCFQEKINSAVTIFDISMKHFKMYGKR